MSNGITLPGGPEAVKKGCLCPVIDNAHGKGYLGGTKDDNGDTLYVRREDCPLHGLPVHPGGRLG